MNLYRDILQDRWNEVNPKVRKSHLSGEELHADCCLDVVGSSNFLGRIIGRLVSLPASMNSAPVHLLIRSSPEGEIWERSFPDCRLNSVQFPSSDGSLVDRFGIIAFSFRLETCNGGILHHHTGTYLIGGRFHLRLPRFASPRIISHEEPDPGEDASRISVSLSLPVLGHLLTYSGIVRPMSEKS